MVPKHNFRARDLISAERITEDNLEEIKKWLTGTGIPQLTDEQIVLFLLSCTSDIQETKKTIVSYFEYKLAAPEMHFYRNMNSNELKQAQRVVELSILPARTRNNEAILLTRLKDSSYWNFNLENSIKILFMGLELPLYDDPPSGLMVIMDFQGVGIMHLTRLRLNIMKKFFQYVQEGLPCRLKEIHILNCVYFFDKLMSLVKPFMKKELIELINIHSSDCNMDEFFEKWLPKDCMPEDYGGSLPNQKTLCEQTYDKFRQLEEFYAQEEEQVKMYKRK